MCSHGYECHFLASLLDNTMPGVREASEGKALRWRDTGRLQRSGIWQAVALYTPTIFRSRTIMRTIDWLDADRWVESLNHRKAKEQIARSVLRGKTIVIGRWSRTRYQLLVCGNGF